MGVLESTPADENLHLIDAEMFGLRRYGGLYILKAPRPAIIETGFSHTLEKTLAALDELGIAPKDVAYLMPTHVHMDHAGGAGYLSEACPNARVICHHVGAPHLVDPTKLVRSVQRAVGPNFTYYGRMKPLPQERLIAVRGGERFDLGGGYALEVLDTPGHATHHACFYEHKTQGLFAGDAVGIYRPEIGFILTTPPPAFHYEDWLHTLDRLRDLDLGWLYFTHYGAQDRPYELIAEYESLLVKWVEEIEAKLDETGDERAVKEHFVQKESAALGTIYLPEMLRAEVEMNVQGVLLYLQRHRA